MITVLAEKSTRLPIKLPLTLPSLPFSRAFMAFRGRPDFCTAFGKPVSENKHVTTGKKRYKLCTTFSQSVIEIAPLPVPSRALLVFVAVGTPYPECRYLSEWRRDTEEV